MKAYDNLNLKKSHSSRDQEYKNNLRIFMVGPFPPPITGMAIANKMLFQGLENEHTVIILDTQLQRKLGDYSSQGSFKGKLVGSLGQILSGVKTILTKDLDIIYITPSQNFYGFLKYSPFTLAARFKKLPVIIHIHGGYFRTMYDSLPSFKKWLIRRVLRWISSVIVLGDSLTFMFKDIVPKDRIQICENGVENTIIPSRDEIERKLSYMKTALSIDILFLSNLMKTKGILELLEAIKLLIERGYSVHLDVAGEIEPSMKRTIQIYMDMLGERVTYHGVVNGISKKNLLLSNNIFCLPTYYPTEGQPISILEAMVSGCAIVTCDQGGIRDIIQEGLNGLYAEQKNPVYLADTILKCHENCYDYAYYNSNNSEYKFSQKAFVQRVKQILLDEAKSNKKDIVYKGCLPS